MWKIHLIALCVICTVCGVLFLPLYVVISVLFVVLSGIVLFHDLPFSFHVASIRIWFESFYNSVVNTFHQSNQTLLSPRRPFQSNGIVKNHAEFFANKRSVTPNLISRNKLCKDQDLPESFIMPLKNCNLHSTPVGASKDNVEKGRKIIINEDSCSNSWSDKKETIFSPKSVVKNVQSVAGPLLVSTRFNSGISAELSADVSSMGFSGRVAQKGSAKDGVTHQSKYSGIGVFPIVQLSSRSPKHSISPRSSPATSKAVRVRIAPPDNSPFGGLENSVFSHSGEGDSMKSVLQVLKDMSRKRIHSQVDEEEDDKVKRQKKEYDENTPKICLDGGLQNKRGRDDSPRSSEEVKRQRRQTNTTGSNEIMSSLSSSLAVKPPHLMKGTKRKAHAVDWSRSTTPVSGKLLKVNVSPVAKLLHQPSPSQDEEKLSNKQAKDSAKEVVSPSKTEEISDGKQSPVNRPTMKNNSVNTEMKGNDCIRIEAGQRRVLARAGDLKEVPIHEMRNCDSENEVSVPRMNESAPTISVQRIKDPGRRLKDMLAAIDGSDDIDADTSIMSPSVVAILKTAKTSSRQSKQSLDSSKLEPTGFKSPVSILKTPGRHESHKTVTFCDQVNSTAEKSNVSPVSAVSDSSPQTCLTTATVVSNSINTSISSASETVHFDYSGFGGTFKSANSTMSSPTVTFSTSTPSTSVFPSVVGAVTTASVTPNQPQTQSPFSSSGFMTEVKTCVSPSPFNIGSPTGREDSVKVSGPSNKADFGKTISSVSPSGFSFNNFKSPETSQVPVLKPPAIGVTALNSDVITKDSSVGISSSFSVPQSVPLTSVVSENTPLKSALFTFGVGSKPAETNLSEISKSSEDKKTLESSQKSLFGGFGGNVAESTPNNSFSNTNVKPVVPSFGGFGTPSTIVASSSAIVSSSGTINSFSNTAQTSTTPSFMSSSSTSANSIFSFGSNTVSANQTSMFGSAVSQPSAQPSMFSSNPAISTSSQNVPNSSSVISQQSLFGSTQSNIQTPLSVANTSTANPPSVFGSFQATTTSSTPSFGSGSVFTGIPNKSQGFGSTSVFSSSGNANTTASPPATTCSPSLFNSFSSTPIQSSGFGNTNPAIGSSFPAAPSTTSAPVFGQAASSSLFAFGSPAVTTQNSVFGSGSNPVNSNATNVNGPHSSFSTFARDNNISTTDTKNKPSPFGATFQTPSFNFGSSSTPSSNTFAFGSSSAAATTTTTATPVFNSFKPPEPKPFGFEAPQTSIQNSTPVFAFGQNNNSAQPAAAPSFQFNAASTSQQPSTAGIFNFGTGTNATNSPFGTGINPPVFNIGAGGTPAGSAMFSIGSGGTVARSRTVGRARRTK